MKKLLTLSIIAFGIAGCTSVMYETDAVGVGYSDEELKLSPCACLEVKQLDGMQEWNGII